MRITGILSSPIVRISFALVLLTTTIIVAGEMLGLTPNEGARMLQARKAVCESLAVQFSSLAASQDLATIERTLKGLVERDPDILSAAVRNGSGTLLAVQGDHERHWQAPPGDTSTPTNAQVPIFDGSTRWGTVEVRFSPISTQGILGMWQTSLFRLVLFVAVTGFISYLLFMRKALRQLDPTAVVPARVKYALDMLAEGVLLVDEQGQIVLANKAFGEKVGQAAAALTGQNAAALKWAEPETGELPENLPWTKAMLEGQRQTGTALTLPAPTGGQQIFVVNGAPILDGKGKSRGAVATFNDITELEKKNRQLEETLKLLKDSRDEIEARNRQLQVLANSDPLTGCLNRRSFFERLERLFIKAQAGGHDLTCVMVDIDHFKSFNDRYGHAVGDKVLQKVAELLRADLSNKDLICRYGGEEFCIILPSIDESNAIEKAQAMRASIEAASQSTLRMTSGENVTASFGVSVASLGARDSAELLNQADKALYSSKEGGRNRVTLWSPADGLHPAASARG